MIDFTKNTPSDYQEQTFKNLDCAGQVIRFKNYEDCQFVGCTFTETAFQECTFRNCRFRDCDFSLAKVKETVFSQVHFEECKLVGIIWPEARWDRAGLLGTKVDFVGCSLNYSSFSGLKLPKMQFTRCTAREVDFAEADLSGANCSDTDFEESRFLHTNLTGADFTGATHYSINVTQNTIKKARFSMPEAMSLLYSLDIVLVE